MEILDGVNCSQTLQVLVLVLVLGAQVLVLVLELQVLVLGSPQKFLRTE